MKQNQKVTLQALYGGEYQINQLTNTAKVLIGQDEGEPLFAPHYWEPMNDKPKNPAAVALGRLGGKAGRGQAKARKVSSEQARKAANARWAKAKPKNVSALILEAWAPKTNTTPQNGKH